MQSKCTARVDKFKMIVGGFKIFRTKKFRVVASKCLHEADFKEASDINNKYLSGLNLICRKNANDLFV